MDNKILNTLDDSLRQKALEPNHAKLIEEISIKNYKSIKELIKFPLHNINILIGANGSGKSNFLSFFDFVKNGDDIRNNVEIFANINSYVAKHGGADDILFLGRRNSEFLSGAVALSDQYFTGKGGKKFIAPTNMMLICDTYVNMNLINMTVINNYEDEADYAYDCHDIDISWRFLSDNTTQYHFHDTSKLSPILVDCMLNNNDMLLPNGKNIMPFVYRIYRENKQSYSMIVNAIRSCVDDFHDFYIRKNINSDDMVSLEWQHKHDLGEPKHGKLLSDGSLRIICLIVLLLQPIEWVPKLVIIDEPELGMHPKALSLIAELIKQISPQKQFIIATQSPEFINLFNPEDIIVCDKNEDSSSSFTRLDAEKLQSWLDDYTVADLWQMNIIGGQK